MYVHLDYQLNKTLFKKIQKLKLVFRPGKRPARTNMERLKLYK